MKVEAELDTLRAQRQGAHRLVQVEVEGAYADAVAARDRLAAAQGSLGAGKSWFRSAALNFGLGVDDAKALLDAYSGYVESQVGLASASYDLIVARARLDQLTGKALSQGEGTCKLP
jgi:outer membrane protein TolC